MFSLLAFLLFISFAIDHVRYINDSSKAPRLAGQTSIIGVIFFVSRFLLRIEEQTKLKKNYNYDLIKPPVAMLEF